MIVAWPALHPQIVQRMYFLARLNAMAAGRPRLAVTQASLQPLPPQVADVFDIIGLQSFAGNARMSS